MWGFNVAQEMFDADFFGFFRFDRGWDVCEGTLGRRSVLSRRINIRSWHAVEGTHVFDLLDGKVRVGWDSDITSSAGRSHIDDHHHLINPSARTPDMTETDTHRPRHEPLQTLTDIQIRRSQLRTSMVEPDRSFLGYTSGNPGSGKPCSVWEGQRTVHFSEHLPHALDVIQIQEPRLGILVIFLERNGKPTTNRRSITSPFPN